MFGSLVTGSLWALITPTMVIVVGALALLPVIANMRGNLSGIFSSRLGTGLNLGTIRPRFSERTRDLNNTIISNVVASFFTPIWVSLIVWSILSLISVINPNIVFQTSLTSFIIITLSASIFAMLLTIPITLFFSFNIFRRGIDPDVLGYPLLSNIADIITVIGIFLGFNVLLLLDNLILSLLDWFLELIFIMLLIMFITYTFARQTTRNQFEVFNLLYEIIPVLFSVTIIASIAGILFNSDLISYPGIVIIVPVFMAYTGATASIIGSRYTTAYFLGTLQTQEGRKRIYISEPFILFALGLLLSTGLGLIAYLLSNILGLEVPGNDIIPYLIICWVTGMFTTLYSVLSSLIVGNLVFRKGIDADNVIVPFSSTTGDLVAIFVIILITAIVS